jgi:hypothetical protein
MSLKDHPVEVSKVQMLLRIRSSKYLTNTVANLLKSSHHRQEQDRHKSMKHMEVSLKEKENLEENKSSQKPVVNLLEILHKHQSKVQKLILRMLHRMNCLNQQ